MRNSPRFFLDDVLRPEEEVEAMGEGEEDEDRIGGEEEEEERDETVGEGEDEKEEEEEEEDEDVAREEETRCSLRLNASILSLSNALVSLLLSCSLSTRISNSLSEFSLVSKASKREEGSPEEMRRERR